MKLSFDHLKNESLAIYSVRGGLHSCFTSSIASYMQTCGIDHELAIGSQLFSAICIAPNNDPQITFTHYFNPLQGERSTHSLKLVRKSAAAACDAIGSIAEECKKTGSVIVVGDAGRLPWQVTFEKKHAPHWFLVDAVSEQDRALHVIDLFEFIDERGEQRAFSGWLSFDELENIIPVNSERNPFFEHRERWAFGSREDFSQTAHENFQWFEAVAPHQARALTSAESLQLLRDTHFYHGQAQRPPHLPHPEWICGMDAVRRLPEYFAAHLNDPNLYRISDDLWVAARSRALFARTLARLGNALQHESLCRLAASCDEQLVPQWLGLPRVMHYNASCLERGRAPRALLVDLMSKVVDQEQLFMDQLGSVLESC